MSSIAPPASGIVQPPRRTYELVMAGMKRRRAAEWRFRLYGKLAVGLGLLFLVLLFGSIIANGYTAFWQTQIRLDVTLDAAAIDPQGTRDPEVLRKSDYLGLIRSDLREMFPDVSGRRERLALYGLVSNGASFDLRDKVLANPDLIGTTVSLWVPADDDIDMLVKGHIDRTGTAVERRVGDNQLLWMDTPVDR